MLFYFIIIIGLITFFNSPKGKGILGEFVINLSTKFLLDKDTYHLRKNVTLSTENGTTQIDHIIVSLYGIFVIETKNMKGWIFGSQNQKTWTQKIYKKSFKFQNPLHQNYKHVKTLEKLLNLNDGQIFSLVVFIGESTFKTEMPANVTYGGGYVRYIKTKRYPIFTREQVSSILSQIDNGSLQNSFTTNTNHVRHVRAIVREKKNNMICSKCGNEMVVRIAKKGPNPGRQFLGCSNFPNCKATKKIE